MQWEWSHNPIDTAWSLFDRPGWLRMKTVNVTKDMYRARNMLTQRIFANKTKSSTGSIRLDVSHLTEGDRAGISIFQDPYAMICVERTADGYQLLWKQDSVRSETSQHGEQTLPIVLPDSIIYLRASIKYGDDVATFAYSLDNETWTSFGGETKQSFNLSVFVGSRFGLFCYATKKKGGYADFDWFTTEPVFDEATLYPEDFKVRDSSQFTATKLAVAQKTYNTMIGHSAFPILNATYADKQTSNVAAFTAFKPDSAGVVEFSNGEMLGVGQGKTKVAASYTDLYGNSFDATFDATSSYFPIDAQYVSACVTGQGTFKVQATNKGYFKFGNNNQMGWNFNQAIDMSDYNYLVIKFSPKPPSDVNLNIYTSADLNGPCYTQLVERENEVIVDLKNAKYTSTSSKGRSLATKSVYMVTFSAPANRYFYVTDMYLTNDVEDMTGIVSVAPRQQSSRVSVYSLSGQQLRHNVEHGTALQGLPAGIYIVGGKKVIVR